MAEGVGEGEEGNILSTTTEGEQQDLTAITDEVSHMEVSIITSLWLNVFDFELLSFESSLHLYLLSVMANKDFEFRVILINSLF